MPGSKNIVAKKSSDVVSLLEVNNNVTNDEVKGLIFLLATQLKNTGNNSEKISNIIDTFKTLVASQKIIAKTKKNTDN